MTMSINMHDRKRMISTFRPKDGSFVALTIREEEDRNEITLYFHDENDLLDFAKRIAAAAKWIANDSERKNKDSVRDEKAQAEMMARLNMKKVSRFAKALNLIPGEILSDDPFYKVPTGYALFDASDPDHPVAQGSDFDSLRNDYNSKYNRGGDSR